MRLLFGAVLRAAIGRASGRDVSMRLLSCAVLRAAIGRASGRENAMRLLSCAEHCAFNRVNILLSPRKHPKQNWHSCGRKQANQYPQNASNHKMPPRSDIGITLAHYPVFIMFKLAVIPMMSGFLNSQQLLSCGHSAQSLQFLLCQCSIVKNKIQIPRHWSYNFSSEHNHASVI